MANNVTNIIELRGKPERVQKLLEAIANEEYGSGSMVLVHRSLIPASREH